MGVIYKLKPEIKDFIIDQKEKDQTLSCRKLTILVDEKFKIKLSKCRINSIIKSQGLSSRVGRRPKPKRGIIEAEELGIYMLRAADLLIGGTQRLAELLKDYLPGREEVLNNIETLLYSLLFLDDLKPGSVIYRLGKTDKRKVILSYLNELQLVTKSNEAALQALNNLLEEILLLRITFSDNTAFDFDGQFHTFWPSTNIPHVFSTTPYKIKSYVEKIYKGEEPIILFTAPGYESFPASWFDFLVKCNTQNAGITQVSLFGIKTQELDKIPSVAPKTCNIIFGLWPWQYLNYRKFESVNSPVPFFFAGKRLNLYLEDSAIKLSQPNSNQSVTLRAVILKNGRDAKPEVFVLTNMPKEKAQPEDIASLYLSRWPNLQNGFKEFSRNIELFTYNVSSRQDFPKEKILNLFISKGINEILSVYLDILDHYVRWYFFPQEYRALDLSTMKSRFYGLKGQIRKRKNVCEIKLIPLKDYAYRKDLTYALDRLNERDISSLDSGRIWFTIR